MRSDETGVRHGSSGSKQHRPPHRCGTAGLNRRGVAGRPAHLRRRRLLLGQADQIHQSTHNHGDNSFIPWHRELSTATRPLLRQSNPDVALHYWDWTEDPRAASDGQGGTVDLTDPSLFGTFAAC